MLSPFSSFKILLDAHRCLYLVRIGRYARTLLHAPHGGFIDFAIAYSTYFSYTHTSHSCFMRNNILSHREENKKNDIALSFGMGDGVVNTVSDIIHRW